ncbi:MAG: hypothetical protein ACQESB_07035, partial [Elusimicrobiota bacterium]
MQIAIDKYFKELLILMNQKSASDLHISVGSPPYIRVDSELFPLTFPALTEDECKKMLFSIMNRKQIRAFKENK